MCGPDLQLVRDNNGPIRANGAPYGGSVVNQTVNTYVDANGITDPEEVGELAATRTLQAITILAGEANR